MRLIDADELLKQYNDKMSDLISTTTVSKDCGADALSLLAGEYLIRSAPSVAGRLFEHAKWEFVANQCFKDPVEWTFQCSSCRHQTVTHNSARPWENYCPMCGAQMDAVS